MTSERIRALDGLRALAVALVFIHHAFPTYFPGGFIGVDIFFVISGFVITSALMRDGIDFRRFYIHRFFRIIPPVVPVLLFVLTAYMFDIALASPTDVASSAFSLMNWMRAFEVSSGDYLGHFWSLAIEEQFYLLWPGLLALLLGVRTRPASIVVTLLIMSLAVQVALFVSGASVERIYNGLDSRASQLLMGCLLFFVLDRVQVPSLIAVSALSALLACALLIEPYSAFYLTAGIGLVGALSAVMIANMAQGTALWQWPFLLPIAQWGGSRSYAIYLWHFPLLGLFKLAGWPNATGAVAAGAATCLAAEVSMRLVERPARAMRDRFTSADRVAA